MEDEACVRFLQWSLPRLRYRWKGFRKVRRQVCRRLDRRISELGLPDVRAYRDYLEDHHGEWEILDSLCHVSISRFYRDRSVFDRLRSDILPALARAASERGIGELLCWSSGCCSGEEPYTLRILWDLCVESGLGTGLQFRITATDRNPHVLDRADRAVYAQSSLKELPGPLIEQAFEKLNGGYRLRPRFKKGVAFRRQDIRDGLPDGRYDLILCRNLVFTYFDGDLQDHILKAICNRLKPNGYLVIGAHESLPPCEGTLTPVDASGSIYRRA